MLCIHTYTWINRETNAAPFSRENYFFTVTTRERKKKKKEFRKGYSSSLQENKSKKVHAIHIDVLFSRKKSTERIISRNPLCFVVLSLYFCCSGGGCFFDVCQICLRVYSALRVVLLWIWIIFYLIFLSVCECLSFELQYFFFSFSLSLSLSILFFFSF